VNKLLYLLFLSVFFLDFFHFELGIVPRSATWLPEILAILTCLVIVLRFATLKEKPAIHPKYVTLLLLYSTIILLGIILNTTPPGSIIVGMRIYFKHLPFFLLPAVYDFSEEQFKKQLQFILPLLILQCPLAVYQRLFQYRGVRTGDVITGTLDVSSALSIILICSIAVIFALYLKKQICLRFFLITTCCLFLPTTLNETKGTLVLLPVALTLPAFFFRGEKSSKAKSLLTMALIGVLFISAFVPIYNHFNKPVRGSGILGFFQNKGEVEKYLYRGATTERPEHIRRGDAIVLAWKDLSKDSLTLAFGLGMGNLMHSYFGSCLGKHADKTQYGSQMLAVTNLFWELGLLGLIVYVTFFVFLFRDALLLRESADIFGSFALGWSAVVVIIGFSLVYKNTIHFNAINFLFWYFSGIVAAKTFRMRVLPS
jgi:hypothetical protein